VDDIETENDNDLPGADQDAVDHIATPLGLPALGTGAISRRFIHRSLREHLVAEHVAALSVEQAAEILLPHLWYDPDWEYAAPAALARHPDRNEILRRLLSEAARSASIPEDLSTIDAGWQIRTFLAQVAAESRETDWSPEMADLISRAREDLAQALQFGALEGAGYWPISNGRIQDQLLALIGGYNRRILGEKLLDGLARVATTEEGRGRARKKILEIADNVIQPSETEQIMRGLLQLSPTEEDKHHARQTIIKALSDPTNNWSAICLADMLLKFNPTEEEKHDARKEALRLLRTVTDWRVQSLTEILVRLDLATEEKRLARQSLINRIATCHVATSADSAIILYQSKGLVRLAVTDQDK
jgi:hypothetical protein